MLSKLEAERDKLHKDIAKIGVLKEREIRAAEQEAAQEGASALSFGDAVSSTYTGKSPTSG